MPFPAGAGRVRDFLESIGESNPPFAEDRPSTRFGAPLLPPTYLAQVRTTADPELRIPRYGSTLNAGNEYRWLRPAYPGERLERQSRVVDAYVREGRTGRLTFIVSETTLRRLDGEVVATGRATTVQRS